MKHFTLPRMRRERADKLVSATIAVALDINANAAMPHYVRKLSVFGSYLGTDPILTDLTLAYELGTRHEPCVRGERLIAACLKLGKGMQVSTHTEIAATAGPHRVIFEITDPLE
jgi:hypothetical protein